MEINIQYLHHSGFAVKIGNTTLVFDYDGSETIPREFMETSQKTIVFVSHGHGDHYSSKIWEWAEKFPNVSYVLSDDIKAPRIDNCTLIAPHTLIETEGFSISTLTSTDEGVAFLIEKDGVCIYYAGDLNWWHWNGEPHWWNKKMREDYKREIDRLRGKKIELAFVPLDPRLEDKYLLGLDYFMRNTDTQKVVPMHLWDNFVVFDWLKQEPLTKPYFKKIIQMTVPSEIVECSL